MTASAPSDFPFIHFDGPAGTQVPDSVLEAISDYLRTGNANAGGKFATSQQTSRLIVSARQAAASLLGVAADEVTFGANMTSLNFSLTRAASRDWIAGDEVVTTKLDHEANISPWLEIARDKGVIVRMADLDSECRIDLEHLRSIVGPRTKVVAFPMASNAVGVIAPAREVVEIAHSVGALAWVDAVHYAPHNEVRIPEIGCDVLLCSPYKFFGTPHGSGVGSSRDLRQLDPNKVRPQAGGPGQRYETGTLPHELLSGFVACVDYLQSVGWDFILRQEYMLGQRFLEGLPSSWALHGPQTMEGRVTTFCLSPQDETPSQATARLAASGLAVWDGNFYAVELFKHLGLSDGGVRIGILHTNNEVEIDQLLAALTHELTRENAHHGRLAQARCHGPDSQRERFQVSRRRLTVLSFELDGSRIQLRPQ